ncbi:GAF domain-containing sensor histidine kinase [Aliikangiella sp. IMCC44359]|uniref:GAF domain-containing sensor histidine kinase n=1 Tax=Aliikangiella sp. IMCC44359 TaxID=3459125 RepID=UPI00403B3140
MEHLNKKQTNVPENQYIKAYEREKKSRQLAEKLLNDKSREVYDNLIKIKLQNETLEYQKKELELLVEVANFTKHELSFTENLTRYLNAVAKLLEAPYGLIYLKVKDSKKELSADFFYPNQTDFPSSLKECIKKTQSFNNDSIPGKVLKSQKVFIWNVDDNTSISPQRITVAKELSIMGAIAIPIKRFNEIVAVAEFGINDFSNIRESTIQNSETAALQLSTALERRKSQKNIIASFASLQKAHEELKSTQKQLIQSEKMASLGQIAAGVAHEINNPVGYVISNIDTLEEYTHTFISLINQYTEVENFFLQNKLNAIPKKLELIQLTKENDDYNFIKNDIGEMLEDSAQGLQRVKEIVANLKVFSHAGDSRLEEQNINQCIENTLKVIWNELKYTVTVNKHYGELPNIKCHIGQLSQVFMNLLVNAKDACGEQGHIEIQTQLKNNMVEITFSDNGEGIPDDKLSKIFDPFFTSKPVGKGTGLGLSVSYGIIEQHQGSIQVTSQVGKGTCFKILLPCNISQEKFSSS